jgi:AcrR family transcriptional regulator
MRPPASDRTGHPDRTRIHRTGADLPAAPTDGRQLRRARNREAVVEALLDLYSEGNLRPGSEEIAARSGLSPRSLFRYFDDLNDLIRAAIECQEERAVPLVLIEAAPDSPLEVRIAALVDQRFRLFAAVGNAAAVVRLHSPFQPLLAETLARNRDFLRTQMQWLFAPELDALGGTAAGRVLAVADVVASFESWYLLLDDQGLSAPEARATMATGLHALLAPSG